MIELPDPKKSLFYEEGFYLTCSKQRLNKTLSCYELFKKTLDIPGAIIECGVFKGVSLIRWATLRDIFSDPYAKKVIGFDIFGKYPEANLPEDKLHRKSFIKGAGEGISKEQLESILVQKDITNVELIEGDIIKTVPHYTKQYPELKISLLYLDCPIYEPTLAALENFYDRIMPGGFLLLNGYAKIAHSGETKAVDSFFVNKDISIRRLPFSFSPCYLVKKNYQAS